MAVTRALASHVLPDSRSHLPARTFGPRPCQAGAATILARSSRRGRAHLGQDPGRLGETGATIVLPSPEGPAEGKRPKSPSPARTRCPTAAVLPTFRAGRHLSLTYCTSAPLTEFLTMSGLTLDTPRHPSRTSGCPVVLSSPEGVLCWSSWLSPREWLASWSSGTPLPAGCQVVSETLLSDGGCSS